MSNYTTKTAALKATKIDSRLLNANKIDTKKLFINGVSIENFYTDYAYMMQFGDGEIVFSIKIPMSSLVTGNVQGVEENVVDIETITINDQDMYVLVFQTLEEDIWGTYRFVCIPPQQHLQNVMFEQMGFDGNQAHFVLYYDGDDISELYGGTLVNGFLYCFSREFTPSTQTSSTYSLRQPEVTPSLLEKVKQIFEERKQQIR